MSARVFAFPADAARARAVVESIDRQTAPRIEEWRARRGQHTAESGPTFPGPGGDPKYPVWAGAPGHLTGVAAGPRPPDCTVEGYRSRAGLDAAGETPAPPNILREFARDNRRLLALLCGPVLAGSAYTFLSLRAVLGLVVGLLVAALVTVTVLVATGDADEVGQVVSGRRRR